MSRITAKVKGHLAGLGYWWARGLSVFLLVPCSVLAVFYWRVPVTDPLTVSALLVDRVLEVSTAFVLPVAVLLLILASSRLASAAAVGGGIVSVVLGTSTSLAALRPPVKAWKTALAVITLVAGIVLLGWMLRRKLSSTRWRVSLLAPLALLPALQFWHATSFVPAHLTTSVGAKVRVTGQVVEGRGARGIVEVDIRNSGHVTALVLASELIICFRSEPTDFLGQDELYADPACITHVIFEALSDLDSRSTWTIRRTFSKSPSESDKAYRLVQAVVLLWHARGDRLRVDVNSRLDLPNEPDCRPGELARYDVEPESRYKGVVQTQRRLLYLDTREGGDRYFALGTKGEPSCDSNEGLPKDSRYEIDQYVGLTTLRLNHEDWLSTGE